MTDPAAIGPALREAAFRAARIALAIREDDRLDVRRKEDRSPVSAGDLAANEEILRVLGDRFPEIPVVSEESPLPDLEPGETFFCVDPIDGTRDYISGGSEFTVNIALVRDETPTAGIVLAPALGRGIETAGDGSAKRFGWDARSGDATVLPLPAAWSPNAGRTAAVSRSHLNRRTRDWLAGTRFDLRRVCGSSWKFALLAEREAAVYPRLSPTHSWDIAAGHAVLVAAGGRVVAPHGDAPVRYGTGAADVPGFVAYAPGL